MSDSSSSPVSCPTPFEKYIRERGDEDGDEAAVCAMREARASVD